jgi:hypothetical protein
VIQDYKTPVEGGGEDRFLTEHDAAKVLSLSVSYLRKLRSVGGGPQFNSFGRAIRYRRSILFAWADAHAARSTSQRDAA